MTRVRDLLGHSSLLVTSRYSHIFDAGLDDVKTIATTQHGVLRDQTTTRH